MDEAQIPTVRFDEVFHVGSLDLSSKTTRASLEGPCLSVSVNPEEWGHIARATGETWTLSLEGSLWFDATNACDELIDRITEWGLEEGLVERRDVWRSWHFDGESDDWAYMSFENREEAVNEIDDECLDEADNPHTEDGSYVDSVPGLILTEKAMDILERWDDRLSGLDGLLILYPMIELSKSLPDLVGVWWDEDFNPLSLSCPRGGVFPGRMNDFEITDSAGTVFDPANATPSPE